MPSSTRQYQPASTKAAVRRMSAAPFHPSRSGRESNSERCPRAELELLHAIVRAFGKWHCIVKAQRTEGRCEDQTDAHRGANDIAVVKYQPCAGSRRGGIAGRGNATGRIDFARRCPGCRSLIVIER